MPINHYHEHSSGSSDNGLEGSNWTQEKTEQGRSFCSLPQILFGLPQRKWDRQGMYLYTAWEMWEIFNWQGGKEGRKEKNTRNKERKAMPGEQYRDLGIDGKTV